MRRSWRVCPAPLRVDVDNGSLRVKETLQFCHETLEESTSRCTRGWERGNRVEYLPGIFRIACIEILVPGMHSLGPYSGTARKYTGRVECMAKGNNMVKGNSTNRWSIAKDTLVRVRKSAKPGGSLG